MPYDYIAEKPGLFTDDGQRQFLRILDHVRKLLRESGACTMGAALRGAGSGSSWQMMACVDRMVELGEIRRITPVGSCAGQDEVFVSAKGRD